MDCRECGTTGATEVNVEFTDGAEREIPLCEACREDYREGHFVRGLESE